MARIQSLLAIGACGAVIAGVGAGPALGGEVTGNGKKEDFSQGRSICKFSGLNDDPTGETEGPPGRVQSFGQDVAAGRADPREFGPGIACNPNTPEE